MPRIYGIGSDEDRWNRGACATAMLGNAGTTDATVILSGLKIHFKVFAPFFSARFSVQETLGAPSVIPDLPSGGLDLGQP